jgi:hypothetical protein
MTHEQLLQCLAHLVEKGGFTALGNSAAFNLSQDGDNKGVLPGAVYCIALPASSREDVSIQLEAEEKTKLSLRTPLERIRKLVIN